jgi:hypothetical protein
LLPVALVVIILALRPARADKNPCAISPPWARGLSSASAAARAARGCSRPDLLGAIDSLGPLHAAEGAVLAEIDAMPALGCADRSCGCRSRRGMTCLWRISCTKSTAGTKSLSSDTITAMS